LLVKVKPANKALKANIEGYIGTSVTAMKKPFALQSRG
jgi:hypothetical protein